VGEVASPYLRRTFSVSGLKQNHNRDFTLRVDEVDLAVETRPAYSDG
jgi:hypothetical protein